LIKKIAQNIEAEVSKVKLTAKSKKKTRMQKITELVESGKFRP